MFIIQHNSIWPNFVLTVLRIQKKNKDRCNFHYVAMSMITSETMKSVNFTKKTQKFRCFGNET